MLARPRRQAAAMTVAPAAVLSGALLTGGRRGKALAACPLLGAAAGGFSGKGAPSASMLELTASSMAGPGSSGLPAPRCALFPFLSH